MDRLEFMETLNEEIKELKARKEELSDKCHEMYKYTVEHLREILKEPESGNITTSMGVNMAYLKDSGSSIIMDGHDVISTNNSKNMIIKLSSTISQLKNDCEELENKLQKYKNDDIRKVLPYLNE